MMEGKISVFDGGRKKSLCLMVEEKISMFDDGGKNLCLMVQEKNLCI